VLLIPQNAMILDRFREPRGLEANSFFGCNLVSGVRHSSRKLTLVACLRFCHSRASALSGVRGIPDSGTLRAAATREGDKQRMHFPPIIYAANFKLRTLESWRWYVSGSDAYQQPDRAILRACPFYLTNRVKRATRAAAADN
jgi:hypothetical protein